jgi:hypothetical protein
MLSEEQLRALAAEMESRRVEPSSSPPADGAIGAHMDAVQRCYRDFDGLAATIFREASRRQSLAGAS